MRLLTQNIRLIKWNVSLPGILWSVLAILGVLLKIKLGENKINNYLIFKNVFWHTLHQTNLYLEYPTEYFDANHYGPFFSIIIAPFAQLPTNIGCFMWSLLNIAFLFYAIRKLPISYKNQNTILLISTIEMMTSVQNTQSNPAIAAGIIFTLLCVRNEKDFWAAFFIVAGFYIKLYGIVGIAFFCFSKHKVKFILSFIFWLTSLFFLPMIISSPSFIIQSYHDWYNSLVHKNIANSVSTMQNQCVMGLFGHIFNIKNLTLPVLIPAAFLYALPLLRKIQLQSSAFMFSYLAFALIGVVIFSSSAESGTYIIAITGVGIWFTLQNKRTLYVLLLIFTLIITSLSSTDLFPEYIKVHAIRPYSLKALPCFLIWLILAKQLLVKDFNPVKTAE